MTTILIINAVSTVLGAAGITGVLAWENRRTRRQVLIRPMYVTTSRTNRALGRR